MFYSNTLHCDVIVRVITRNDGKGMNPSCRIHGLLHGAPHSLSIAVFIMIAAHMY